MMRLMMPVQANSSVPVKKGFLWIDFTKDLPDKIMLLQYMRGVSWAERRKKGKPEKTLLSELAGTMAFRIATTLFSGYNER